MTVNADSFQALLIEKDDAGYRAQLQTLNTDALMAATQSTVNPVTIRVSHSTLNYKDGLAITGKSPVVRKFPMVPGIDLAGTVEHSEHPLYAVSYTHLTLPTILRV